jgi:hypothetical protein
MRILHERLYITGNNKLVYYEKTIVSNLVIFSCYELHYAFVKNCYRQKDPKITFGRIQENK